MNWKVWLTGLANGAVSALASGLITAGLGSGWKQTLIVASGSAAVSVAKWILQHPFPGAPAN